MSDLVFDLVLSPLRSQPLRAFLISSRSHLFSLTFQGHYFVDSFLWPLVYFRFFSGNVNFSQNFSRSLACHIHYTSSCFSSKVTTSSTSSFKPRIIASSSRQANMLILLSKDFHAHELASPKVPHLVHLLRSLPRQGHNQSHFTISRLSTTPQTFLAAWHLPFTLPTSRRSSFSHHSVEFTF